MLSTPPRSSTRRRLLQVAVLLFFIGSTALVLCNREAFSIARFRALGYTGVFLMAWIGSSVVILPIPHLAFTVMMGSVLNPWWLGLLAGFGDALGELTGYLAGYAVEQEVAHLVLYQRLKVWMTRHGDLTIFGSSLLPIPFFDLPAIAGGVVGYPLWRFFLATWAGKTIKCLAGAWAGYWGIVWVARVLG